MFFSFYRILYMDLTKSLNDYFSEELSELQIDDELKAYIVSIFSKYKSSQHDLSKQSLTIEYSSARFEGSFFKFQNLGDYLFFTNVFYPESLNEASKDYYHSIGQMSYYSCYRIIRSWRIYEQLADRFVDLSDETRVIIQKL